MGGKPKSGESRVFRGLLLSLWNVALIIFRCGIGGCLYCVGILSESRWWRMQGVLPGAGCEPGARGWHGMARGARGGPGRDLSIFGKMKPGGCARVGWGDVSIFGKVKGGLGWPGCWVDLRFILRDAMWAPNPKHDVGIVVILVNAICSYAKIQAASCDKHGYTRDHYRSDSEAFHFLLSADALSRA